MVAALVLNALGALRGELSGRCVNKNAFHCRKSCFRLSPSLFFLLLFAVFSCTTPGCQHTKNGTFVYWKCWESLPEAAVMSFSSN